MKLPLIIAILVGCFSSFAQSSPRVSNYNEVINCDVTLRGETSSYSSSKIIVDGNFEDLSGITMNSGMSLIGQLKFILPLYGYDLAAITSVKLAEITQGSEYLLSYIIDGVASVSRLLEVEPDSDLMMAQFEIESCDE